MVKTLFPGPGFDPVASISESVIDPILNINYLESLANTVFIIIPTITKVKYEMELCLLWF
jgi:hypothetical protein